MIGIVVDKIIGVMKGKNLTTWSIGHTVITDSKLVPLSIFTLSKEKETSYASWLPAKAVSRSFAALSRWTQQSALNAVG